MRHRRQILLLTGAFVSLVTVPWTAVAELSTPEKALVRFVDAHNDDALALLQRVVDINSGTMNFPGVRQVGDIFRAELENLGFTTRWVDGAPFNRAGTLVAERPGEGLHVLLIGHLDTVFAKDSPFQTLTRLPDGKATGPGVSDMKGGDVIMLQSLKALRSIGALDRLSITVVLSGDEEDSGNPLKLARAALRQAGDDADVALGFEDGDGRFETAVVARRGALDWRLEVHGQAAHSSQIFQPEVGAGAVYEASRILNAFREQLSDETDLTFNPGVIVGGTDAELDSDQAHGRAFGKSNVVAEHAIVRGDLRTLTPSQLARTQQRMLQIVANHLPQTSATIEFDEGYPPMASTAGNRRLLESFDQASRDLGLGPVTAVDPRDAGAADISFVAQRVKMALDGLGLSGTGGHTVHETGDLTKLPLQTRRVAVLLYRLSRDHSALDAAN